MGVDNAGSAGVIQVKGGFGLAQAAAIPTTRRVPTFRRSQHSFYAAGAPRAAGRGGPGLPVSEPRGGAARSAPGRGRAQVRREARDFTETYRVLGRRARRLQSGPAGGWLPASRAERGTQFRGCGGGGLPVRPASALLQDAKPERGVAAPGASSCWRPLPPATAPSQVRGLAGRGRAARERGSRAPWAGGADAGWMRGRVSAAAASSSPQPAAPLRLQTGGLRGPQLGPPAGLKPCEASGRQRGVRVYGRPGGRYSLQPQVSLQTLVIKELSHTFRLSPA